MARAIQLWREEPIERDGWTRTGVVIESPWEPRQTLWYSVQLPEGWKLSQSSDAFVLVPLYKAMRGSGPLRVEGEVSPSLLRNLEEFQRFWSCWYPRRFSPVEIIPEREQEQEPGPEGALFAFSGGVDSCHTAYRHALAKAGRQTQTLRAGVMAHGFDIPIGEEQGFQAAAEKAEAMLATLGLSLIRMATNVQRVEHAWDTIVGAAVASCLHLLQPNARVGLIPGSVPYDLDLLWGSHPVSDVLLASDALRILYDAGGYTRPQKIAEIAEWPAAMKNLRVCWVNPRRDTNCGRCGKCIRTILVFRALGLGLPPCFDRDVTDAQIRAAGRIHRESQPFQRMVLDVAREQGVTDSWLQAARSVYYRSRGRDLADLLADHLRRRVRAAVAGRRRA
jgi:hypothetical protein